MGMNDPTSEGFTKQLSGTDPGPAPGNDGLDYWEVDKTGSTTLLSYYIPQLDPSLTAILAAPGGWVISATARVLEAEALDGPGFPSVSVSDSFTGGVAGGDSWYFALVLNTVTPAQSSLSYLNHNGQLTFFATVDVSQYHDYEFTLLPGANAAGFDDVVEVRIDGALQGTLPRNGIPDAGVAPTFRFGDNSAGRSRSRWNHVEFTAVPEPGQPLLLLVAATALRFARPRRSR
jgi:hypothetical protein